MSDNVETIEQPTQTQADQPEVQASPDANQIMAESLWGLNPTAYQNPMQPAPEVQQPDAAEPASEPASTEPAQPVVEPEEVVGLDDYFQREYGMNHAEFKSKWELFNKQPEVQTQEQLAGVNEIQWANEDSKRFFEYLKEGKEDDIYNYLNQKKQLEKLEKYDVADANQAAEIIRANLQFKHKDLSSSEIDRLFNRQYSMPPKPTQSLDQDDAEYAAEVQAWENQVKEKQQDMIIDAKLAKPELANFKSQIVLPDIQKPQVQQQGPTQEELQAAEAGRKAYLNAVESNYQNFKGFTVTAKDGEVQLPISYNVTPEEQIASKDLVSNINVDEFFGKRWVDENNSPKVNQIQEDLYLLMNREKIHQKIATEAFTQMKAHLIKMQNNINLKGVNPTLGPTQPSQQAPKNESQALAEKIWGM